MTGYNHAFACTFGNCVKDRQSRINRADVSASYRVHEAKAFLKRNGLTRSPGDMSIRMPSARLWRGGLFNANPTPQIAPYADC